ncbi:cholesterol transporter ABCA5-like [Physella acuta]|uniref:cholesterol transporter ABCA5-like n=1 Tax=Physella acuta TaxID=109671 RepID=UPI0027DCCCBF|nr:cholesterol transporter ABCA5-like [Physella acuta]
MMASFCKQLKALLWRNILLKKRNPIMLLQELLFPVYCVGLFSVLKILTQQDIRPAIRFPVVNLKDPQLNKVFYSKTEIYVVPNTEKVKNWMDDIFSQLPGSLRYQLFATVEEAEAAYLEASSNVLAGVVFHFTSNTYSYAIRIGYSDFPGHAFTTADFCRNLKDGVDTSSTCYVHSYLTNGFAALQVAIENVLLKNAGITVNLKSRVIQLQLMPKPKFIPDTKHFHAFASIQFASSFSALANFLVVNIVAEKEKKIKEGMLMMGLRTSVFWLAWGLIYLMLVILSSAMIIALIVVSGFFTESNIFMLYICFLLYGSSIITFGFMLTPFFKKSKVAGLFTCFLTVALSFLHLLIKKEPGNYDSSQPTYVQWLMSLLSPVAFAFVIDQGAYLDIFKNGFGFDDSLTFGKFPLYAPILMLVVDTILYLILTIYFDNVIPGEYGVRYSPVYFLKASYWCSSTVKEESLRLMSTSEHKLLAHDVEPIAKDMEEKVGLRISSLTKSYVKYFPELKRVTAVDDFSLDVYESQITCLLGHNGAGKTTLLNVLTGVVSPSSGTATVMGLEITKPKELEYIRNLCGICPQTNILYDELSCAEHLKMFANIKGVPDHLINERIESALKDVDLSDQTHTFAKNLSGGQKRKLSVAIAFIGDPKLVFLDEPTAGMDPFSRRHLWSLLKKKKEGRVILLTTHFMDEADILSDRKAFIQNGKLRCCGSSMFLKNKFGIGYHLTMVIAPECQVDKVTSMLTSVIPSTKHQRTHGKEVAYTMSLNDVPKFSKLFKTIDRNMKLGIEGYGVSMPSLEEVFLNLEGAELVEGDKGEMTHTNLSHSLANDATEVDIQSPDDVDLQIFKPTVKGASLSLQRFKALMKIRFLMVMRSFTALNNQIGAPLGFVAFGLLIAKESHQLPPLDNPGSMDLTHYIYIAPRPSFLALQAPVIYIQLQIPALLVYDAVDNAVSKSVITDLKRRFVVESYPASSKDLAAVAPHLLGIQITSLTPKSLTDFVIIYNDSAIHAIPAGISLATDITLRMNGDIHTHIQVYVLLWPKIPNKSLAVDWNKDTMISIMFVGLAFVLVLPGFAGDIIKDRELKLRGQLRIAGVTFNQYWGTIYLVDILIYLIPSVSVLIIVLAMQVPGFNSQGAVIATILLLTTYIPLNIVMVLLISFLFNKAEQCYSYLPEILILISMLPYTVVSLTDTPQLSHWATAIHYICCVFDPPYIVFGGFHYIVRIYRIAEQNKEEVSTSDYFKFENHVLFAIVIPFVNYFWMYILLCVLDIKKNGGDIKDAFPCHPSSVSEAPVRNTDSYQDQDEDVRAERMRIENLNTSGAKQPVAYTYELRKDYVKRTNKTSLCNTTSMKTKTAVRNLSIGVDEGEVLGLLGPNGAGKTTALSMIIAETKPTCGQVIVNGHNIRSHMLSVMACLGYCPQHDALWETITLKEHLEFYAAVKGVSSKHIGKVVNYYLENMNLRQHRNKQALTLSGGTKRKLSYLLSILGSPQLVLLDEPSTGMDPQSKRFLWNTISADFKNTNRGAILTTHYMEEADALCGRVGIMVNGQLECLGSTQHLKNKYGSGYYLDVKLAGNVSSEMEVCMDDLENHLKTLFPGLENVERFQERAQYSIPKDDVKNLGVTFSHLESCRSTHGLEEYNFSQSTLEQVFLHFAKLQTVEDDVYASDRPKRLSIQK